MAIEKSESNRLYKGEWTPSGAYQLTYSDGLVETFLPARASVKIHDAAKQYGFTVKLNRFHAVSATDFPTVKARMEEGRRRMREWRDHVYSGADTWDMPSKGFGAPRVDRKDIEESLDRAYPGKGQMLFQRKLVELTGDKTPELAAIETVKYWLQTKQVAAAWATIQAERKAAAAATFGDADDEVLRLLGDDV